MIGAAGFVAAAARKLPQPDVWCIMYPSVRTLLQCDVLELDDASILASVSEPVSYLLIKLDVAHDSYRETPSLWRNQQLSRIHHLDSGKSPTPLPPRKQAL
jgi:phosphoinositide-3-kinase regulatory subunit 4